MALNTSTSDKEKFVRGKTKYLTNGKFRKLCKVFRLRLGNDDMFFPIFFCNCSIEQVLTTGSVTNKTDLLYHYHF